ncbi:MAG: hypothetical protein M3Y57_21200 [Acidobacteriota bacterium]|nr:hypothetical protein [Acidobacteriota bacterium]
MIISLDSTQAGMFSVRSCYNAAAILIVSSLGYGAVPTPLKPIFRSGEHHRRLLKSKRLCREWTSQFKNSRLQGSDLGHYWHDDNLVNMIRILVLAVGIRRASTPKGFWPSFFKQTYSDWKSCESRPGKSEEKCVNQTKTSFFVNAGTRNISQLATCLFLPASRTKGFS